MKQYLVIAVEKPTRKIHKAYVEDSCIHGTYVEEYIDSLISEFGDIFWASFHHSIDEAEAEASVLKELDQREAIEYLLEHWGSQGQLVISACLEHATPITLDEFKTHCTCCGGDWGAMLLTGIRDLYPEVWDAIPDDMGLRAFNCILYTMRLLDIIF